jgi:hypothetical protein
MQPLYKRNAIYICKNRVMQSQSKSILLQNHAETSGLDKFFNTLVAPGLPACLKIPVARQQILVAQNKMSTFIYWGFFFQRGAIFCEILR